MTVEELQKALDKFPKWHDWKDNPQLIYDWQTKVSKAFEAFRAEFEKMHRDWAKDRDAMFDYLSEAEELKRKLKVFDGQVPVPNETMAEFGMYVRGMERLWPSIPETKVANPNKYDEGFGGGMYCNLNGYVADFLKVCDRVFAWSLPSKPKSDKKAPSALYDYVLLNRKQLLLELEQKAKDVEKIKLEEYYECCDGDRCQKHTTVWDRNHGVEVLCRTWQAGCCLDKPKKNSKVIDLDDLKEEVEGW